MEFIQSRLSSFGFDNPAGPIQDTSHSSFDRTSIPPDDPTLSKHKSTETSPLKLLSPPLSPTSPFNELPPFRPMASDNTSLSMVHQHKHRSQSRRKAHRTSIEDVRSANEDLEGLILCRSLPDLKVMKWLESSPDVLALKTQLNQLSTGSLPRKRTDDLQRGHRQLPRRPRRWTVPLKAQPSQAFSGVVTPLPRVTRTSRQPKPALEPVVDVVEVQKTGTAPYPDFGPGPHCYSPDTPAMITLRRATRKYSLLQYENERRARSSLGRRASDVGSMLYRSFLSLESKQEVKVEPYEVAFSKTRRPSTMSAAEVSRRRVSLEKDQALPVCDPAALTASTEISVFPVLARAGTPNPGNDHMRRTSTKIISGNSVHEIIWEDQGSSSGHGSDTYASQTPRSNFSASEVMPARGSSVVVGRLQAQLQQCDEHRKIIDTPPLSKTHLPDGEANARPLRKLLSWKWGHHNRTRTSSITLTDANVEDGHQPVRQLATSEEDLEGHIEHVDFFPPLPSRKNSGCWRTPGSPELNSLQAMENALSPTRPTITRPATGNEEHQNMPKAERNLSAPADLPKAMVHSESTFSRSEAGVGDRTHSPLGSALGISSHARRRSADHGPKLKSGHRTSSRLNQKSERRSSAANPEKTDLTRRYSDSIGHRCQDTSNPASRRSSVQEFIARYEAQNEATTRWIASTARGPTAAGGSGKASRVCTLEGVDEDKPAAYISFRKSSHHGEGKEEVEAVDGSEGPEDSSVSVDWIG